MVSCGIPKMKITLKGLAFVFAILPLAGAAIALDSDHVAANEQAFAPRQAVESGADARGMEAACREILVDTDEGYGVTNRESRFICDDNR